MGIFDRSQTMKNIRRARGAKDAASQRTLYVSASASEILTDYLQDRGYELRILQRAGCVSAPVSDHPDMFMCKLGASEGKIVMWNGAELADPYEGGTTRASEFAWQESVTNVLVSYHDPLMRYPRDIAYNAACTGRFLIHNLKYTAPLIIEEAEKAKMKLIDVPQGYAKCSTVVLDKNSIITYDKGIADKCRECDGPKVLLVSPGHVRLEGYNTGFIGGASGRVGDEIVFSGDLSAHPDFPAIVQFIEERGLKCKWFPEFPLTDIGSII